MHVQLLACIPLQLSTPLGHSVLDLTNLAYQPTTKSREHSGHPKRQVTFAMSERNPAYPAHAPDMHEDEDGRWQTTRAASIKEGTCWERRDPTTDDEDLLPLVPPRLPSAAPVRKREGNQLLYWNKRCQGTRASEQRIPRFWAERQKVKPYATSSASCLKSATCGTSI